MPELTTSTMFCLATVPFFGLIGVLLFARRLRRAWLRDVDPFTALALAFVPVLAAFIAAVHAVAFGRLFGWLPGMSAPAITGGFILLLTAGAWALRRYTPSEALPEAPPRQPDRRRIDWLIILPLLVMHALLLVEGLTRAPGGFDALKYQLPMVIMWIRDDAFTLDPSIWMYTLPANGNLITWWLLLAGAERIATVAHWPFGLVLAGAAWTIVRCQRGTRFAGLLAVATLLSTYLIVFQMYNSYIDLFNSSVLAVGVAAMLLAIAPNRPRAVRRLLFLIAGLGLGIAMGSKPTNWVYAPVLATFFLVVHVRREGKLHDLRFLVPMLGLMAASCSAFWFVRAFMRTGNPFMPFQIAIGDHVLFQGFDLGWGCTPSILSAFRSVDAFKEFMLDVPGYVALLNVKYGGIGPLFSMFVPLGMLLATVILVLRKQAARRHERHIVWLLTAVVFVTYVVAIRHYPRFGLIYIMLAVCVAAPMIGRVARFWPVPVRGVAVLATCLACGTVSYRSILNLWERVQSGDYSRAAHYRIPKLIDELPPGTRIVTLGEPEFGGRQVPYALLGKHLHNDALDFMTIEALFPDLSPTLEQLQAANIEYVYIRAPFRDDWSERERLELIYDDEHDPTRPERRPASRIYHVPPPVQAAQNHEDQPRGSQSVNAPISRRYDTESAM